MITNKLNFLIIFNCHGFNYLVELQKSKIFNEKYNTSIISILQYLEKSLDDNAISLIKNADLIIMQNLKNYRPTINNDIIMNLIKKDCKLLLLPHYVFNGYHLYYNLPDDFIEEKSDDELMKIINNFNINNDTIIKNLNNSLEEFKNLELSFNCAISMYEILKKNYKKFRLFNSRGYPTHIFFNLVCKEILNILNIDDDIEIYDICNFASNVRYPILPIVGKTLELEFNYIENIKYGNNNNLIEIDYIHYLLLNKKKIIII